MFNRKVPKKYLKFFDNGKSDEEIAKIFDVTISTIERARRLYFQTQREDNKKMDSAVVESLKTTQLQAKYDMLIRQYRLLEKKVLTQEDFLNTLASLVPSLPIISEVPQYTISENKIGIDLVLLLSDWHCNLIVDKREMENYNEYNFDILVNRFWNCIKSTIEWKTTLESRTYSIQNLYLLFLGDLNNDCHRFEHIATNQMVPVKASLHLSSILAQGILTLSEHFPNVYCVGLIGNEGRVSEKLPAKIQYNHYDWVTYHTTSLTLRNYDTIQWLIPVSPKVVIDINNHRFLLSHGHEVKSWGQNPSYGIRRMKWRELDLRWKAGGFDYWCIGHFHQTGDIDNNEIICNGSLCGLTEFTKNTLGGKADARQRLLGVTANRGIEFIADIYVQNAPKQNRIIYNLNEEAFVNEINLYEEGVIG